MAELWQVISKGTWRERLILAAFALLLIGCSRVFYGLVWLIGGGP